MDLLKSGFFSVLPWITMAISANVSSGCTLQVDASRTHSCGQLQALQQQSLPYQGLMFA